MESVRVEDLMLLVDTLLEETNSGEDKVGSPGLQQPWKLQLNFRWGKTLYLRSFLMYNVCDSDIVQFFFLIKMYEKLCV